MIGRSHTTNIVDYLIRSAVILPRTTESISPMIRLLFSFLNSHRTAEQSNEFQFNLIAKPFQLIPISCTVN